MNVVLYMRYSSDRQTEQSIEGQQRVCTEFCQRKGYTIINKYIDRATSAYKDTEKRIEFNRMIRESEKGQFQAVIVYKLDRFARNRYDSATYKAKLKKNGVSVISATENISDNPEGVILEAVLEGMAEFYSKELAQKISRGMKESALKCNSTGGQIPLGYKIENKKWVIDEPKAKIVREAFEMYSKGKTVTEICEIFNKKGYRTAKGAEFNKNSFSAIFDNERYTGVYKYMDVRVEGGIPAIVDKDTFNAVATRKRSARSVRSGKARTLYLLSSKLFCGHCGASMIGESGVNHNGEIYNYYTCAKRKKNRSCDKKPVRKEWIENLVVEEAMKYLTPDYIEKLADMAIKQNREDIAKDKVIPTCKAEIKDLDKRIKNLFKLVENGADSDMLTERLNELTKQKKLAEQRLADAEGEYIVLEREHIIFWLSKFCNGDINDPEFCRQVIDLLVNSVTIWDDPDGFKITIMYNLTDNKSQTYRVSGSSEFSNVPPLESCPNIVFFANVFVMTIKSRA